MASSGSCGSASTWTSASASCFPPLPCPPTHNPSSSTTGGQWPVLAAVGVLQPGPQLRPVRSHWIYLLASCGRSTAKGAGALCPGVFWQLPVSVGTEVWVVWKLLVCVVFKQLPVSMGMEVWAVCSGSCL